MRLLATFQCLVFFFVVGVYTQLKAQSPEPTQWYQINAPHVNLIFKGHMRQEAQRLTNTLEHLYKPVAQSLGAQPASIPVILWDQQFIFDGCFVYLPRRIDFYTAPTQDYNLIGTNDWFNLLAVHEFRHAVQYAKLKQNFNQLLYWLGGGRALASIRRWFVPLWFFEGDAVGIETVLTKSGRGRIPRFSLLYKTSLLERGDFHYYKQVFGSFEHNVPNHYEVGYYLTTHLRRRYGTEVLADILERTTWPMLFPTAIKRTTGKSLLAIYKDTNEELRGLWQEQLEGLKLTPATSMVQRIDKAYTDYDYPQVDEENNLIVLKSGIGTVAQFVLFNKHRQEQPIFIPGNIHHGVSFSVAQGQMVWTEQVPDLRWEDRYYGVIQRYDIQRKCLHTLSHKSRYQFAALSPDATKIVAVKSDPKYHHPLVILDATDGKVLHRLPNPGNHFYMTPRWLANGQQIVAIKHQQQKVTIALVDALTGASKDLLPYSETPIGVPVPYGQYIFYNSPCSGIDNIYALDLVSQQRYQVTSRKYGAYNPAISADGQWIIFNDFTKKGMNVVKMPFVPQQWAPLETVEDRTLHYYAPLKRQENNEEVLEHIPHQTYPVTPYYPEAHLFNLHSWSWPFHFETTQATQVGVGLIVQSEDLLGTTQFSAGYLHDVQQHRGETFAQLIYKAWYPVIVLTSRLRKNFQDVDLKKEMSLAFQLPFTFQQGQYTNQVSLSTVNSFQTSDYGNWFIRHYLGSFSRTAKKSLRDLQPPWQQELTVDYSYIPYPEYVYRQGLQAVTACTVQTGFHFPGLIKHHSLCIAPRYQYKLTSKRSRSSSHGQHLDHHQKPKCKKSKHAYHVRLAYDWPVYYPDWILEGSLYVKQLCAHLFFEPGYQPQEAIKYTYQVGAGATMDMGISFLSIPFQIGGTVVYDAQKKSSVFSLPLSSVLLEKSPQKLLFCS